MAHSVAIARAVFLTGLSMACAGCFEYLNPLGGSGAKRASTPVCSAATVRCSPEGTQVCEADGSAWVHSACPEGQRCVPGGCASEADCPDACRGVVCAPGERSCHTDNTAVVACNETGTGWCFAESCVVPPMEGVCSEGRCVWTCATEDKSYIGCEYFAVDLDNANVPCDRDPMGNLIFCDAASSQYAVVASNPDPRRTAHVSITRGPLTQQQAVQGACAVADPDPNHVAAAVIPPKGVEIFKLPPRGANGTVKARLAYRVASSIPITVYQFNPLENEDVYSNDASVLLPTTSLGTDYRVMTREQTFDDLKGFLTVVGVDRRGTEVTITSTAHTLPGPGLAAMVPGEVRTVTLGRFEVLNLETDRIGDDLTGSRVQADRPVAVFGGSEAANAPNTSRCDLETLTCEQDGGRECVCTDADGPLCSEHAQCAIRSLITCCADHLEQQLYPTSTWGTEYIAARSVPRGQELDVWRILAATDHTVVTLQPQVAVVPVLDEGEWFELESGEDFVISADKPILVGQFLAAQDAPSPGRQQGDAGIGDPAFILAVPTTQYRDAYVFLAPDKYAEDYATIVSRIGGNARLDGTSVQMLPGADIAPVADSGWQAVRVPIGDGYHELDCQQTCGVTVHGYDRYVSYGYPGGMNLVEQATPPTGSASR